MTFYRVAPLFTSLRIKGLEHECKTAEASPAGPAGNDPSAFPALPDGSGVRRTAGSFLEAPVSACRRCPRRPGWFPPRLDLLGLIVAGRSPYPRRQAAAVSLLILLALILGILLGLPLGQLIGWYNCP